MSTPPTLHPDIATHTTDMLTQLAGLHQRCTDPVRRVAALVEIAGTAAALARITARMRHLDPHTVLPYVSDPTDLYAVLGRGRWLPTMHHPPAHQPDPTKPPKRTRRRTTPAQQNAVILAGER